MASCGGCRLFVLTVRTLLGGPAWTRPAVTQSVSQTRTVVTSTKTCSLEPLSQVQRKSPSATGKGERTSPSSGHTQRNLSAVAVALKGQYRPHSRYELLELGDVVDNTRKALACKTLRRFIVEPALARLVTEHLASDIEHGKAVIFECDPGMYALFCTCYLLILCSSVPCPLILPHTFVLHIYPVVCPVDYDH